ncbi:putative cation channel sperm-associated protein subunit gamma [Paratrimastix pyriformis]|uniref:Cation channel sperm-associated protein subunit gamma n=1 Tax=Paratrimastix pyriformis TaxID=342808 RepID=A0ABQ8UQN5_9EUKA|nr:putative cation channel sperm-associated protein subunit gamma [Paratrimastix pyriformis]
MLFLFLAFFLGASASTTAPLDEPYYWSVTYIDAMTNFSLDFPVLIENNRTYTMCIRISPSASNMADSSLAQTLWRDIDSTRVSLMATRESILLGEVPIILPLATWEGILSDDSLSADSPDPVPYLTDSGDDAYWYVPIRTQRAGILRFEVRGHGVATSIATRVKSTIVTTYVTRFRSAADTAGNAGLFFPLEGTDSANTPVFRVPEAGYAPRLRYVPRVSVEYFLVGHPSSTGVAVSAQLFAPRYLRDLSSTSRTSMYQLLDVSLLLSLPALCPATDSYPADMPFAAPTATPGVYDAAGLRDRAVFLTHAGLVCAVPDDSVQLMRWGVALPACVRQMNIMNQQNPLDQTFGDRLLVASGTRLFANPPFGSATSDSGNGTLWENKCSFGELLDWNNRTLFDLYGSLLGWGPADSPTAHVMGATITSGAPNEVLVLVRGAQLTSVHKYTWAVTTNDTDGSSRVGGDWSLGFVFPVTMCPCATTHGRIENNTQFATAAGSCSCRSAGGTTLNATALQFSEMNSDFLFVTGNVLLVSSDRGASFHASLDPTTTDAASDSDVNATSLIVSGVATNYLGMYAARINNGAVLAGALSTQQVTILQSPVAAATRAVQRATLFYDSDEALRALTVYGPAGGVATDIQRTPLDELQVQCVSHCGEMTLTMWSSHDPVFTREALTYQQGTEEDGLPVGVFLDHDNYTVNVKLYPRNPTASTLREASLRVWLGGHSSSLRIAISSNISYTEGYVWFALQLSDSELATTLQPPGVNMEMSLLHVANPNVDDVSLAPPVTIPVYVGCPPLQTLVFDGLQSMGAEYCDPAWLGAPCFYFDNTFQPRLTLRDDVQETSVNYTGIYRMWIVGGGRELDKVVDFTADQLADFNPGGLNQMWSPTADVDAANDIQVNLLQKDLADVRGPAPPSWAGTGETDDGSRSFHPGGPWVQVSWMSPNGAPWAYQTPRFFFGSPQYFIRVRFETTSFDNSTYCTLATTATVLVHGISLPLSINLAVVGSTLGLAVLLVLVAFFSVLLCAKNGIESVPMITSIQLQDEGGLITTAGKVIADQRVERAQKAQVIHTVGIDEQPTIQAARLADEAGAQAGHQIHEPAAPDAELAALRPSPPVRTPSVEALLMGARKLSARTITPGSTSAMAMGGLGPSSLGAPQPSPTASLGGDAFQRTLPRLGSRRASGADFGKG